MSSEQTVNRKKPRAPPRSYPDWCKEVYAYLDTLHERIKELELTLSLHRQTIVRDHQRKSETMRERNRKRREEHEALLAQNQELRHVLVKAKDFVAKATRPPSLPDDLGYASDGSIVW